MSDVEARRKRGLGHYLVGALLIAVAVGLVGAYVFYQQEISVSIRLRPWERGEYQKLVDRLSEAAAAKDSTSAAASLDGRGVRIVEEKGKSSIQFGQAQRTRTMPLDEFAERGPFRIRDIELQYAGAGGALVRTVGKEDKEMTVVVEAGPGGRRVIAALDFPAAASARPPKRRPPPASKAK